jgi:cell division protease FtsH
VLYGGRTAEELFCEDITTGASNDIQRATQLARMMITQWGMGEKLGAVNFGERTGNDFLGNEYGMGREHSSATQREIDQEVAAILAAQHARARGILEEHRDLSDRVTRALLEYETISKEEFRALVGGADPDGLRPHRRTAGGAGRATPPPLPTAPAPRPVPPPPPSAGGAPEPSGGLA